MTPLLLGETTRERSWVRPAREVERRMRIQSFVFNWPGHSENAARLAADLAAISTVTVINSDPDVAAAHPGWDHLDSEAYFSAQWNRAVELFDADLFFHVQADARPDNVAAVLARAQQVLAGRSAGVYEPNVDYTFFRYDRGLLREVEPGLFEVPVTDCTCWAIRGSIVRQFQPVDVDVNKFGWGISSVVAALCRLEGASCVRDFRFLVRHPNSRGYATDLASREAVRYVNGLPATIRAEVFRCYGDRENLLRLSRGVPGRVSSMPYHFE
jgi:hypothetical protein